MDSRGLAVVVELVVLSLIFSEKNTPVLFGRCIMPGSHLIWSS